MRKAGMAVALVAVLAAGFGFAATASAQTFKWNMATPYSDREFITQLAFQFAKDIEEATDGDVKITVHSAGSLFKNPEIMGAARTGQVQLGSQLMSNLGPEHKLFEIDAMPFLTSNYMETQKLWHVTRPYIEKLMAERGLRILYAVPWGFQNFYWKGKLDSLADIKGHKQRAYNASTSRMAELMGTVPTTVQATDMAQAFQTGIVNGTSTSANTGVSLKMWEYVSDVYIANAWNPKEMDFIVEADFKKLKADVQEAIILAGEKAEAIGWHQSLGIVQRAPKTLAQNGMKVHQASDTLKKELRAIGDTMLNEWLAKADDVSKKAVTEYKAAVGRK